MKTASTTSEKHKLLFESLKGPKPNGLNRSNGQKKTVQPPLRVPKELIDSLPTMRQHNDTDSTMSTITVESGGGGGGGENVANANASCKNNPIVVLDSDVSDAEENRLSGKKRRRKNMIVSPFN